MPGPGFEWIGKEEEKEVLEVLRDGWLFRYGDENDPVFKRKVKTLEEMVEQKFDMKHALAVTSGTAALITALSALGIGPGDEVIVPGYTFIASISSVIIARAVPVLAEIDESLTLDPARCGEEDHAADEGHHGGPHAGQPLRPRCPLGNRDEAQAHPHRGCRTGVRRELQEEAPGHHRKDRDRTPSTSSRPSTPATAAWW